MFWGFTIKNIKHVVIDFLAHEDMTFLEFNLTNATNLADTGIPLIFYHVPTNVCDAVVTYLPNCQTEFTCTPGSTT